MDYFEYNLERTRPGEGAEPEELRFSLDLGGIEVREIQAEPLAADSMPRDARAPESVSG